MPTTCPANIEEFLTFLPKRPKLHPDAKNKTSTADYSARDILPPEYRYISCQPYPDLVPNLKNFIGGVVNDLRIGSVSCQPRQDALDSMAMSSFRAEGDVSQYGSDVTTAVRPVVAAIATAARFAGPIYVLHDSVEETVYAQRDGFNITVVRRRTEIEDSRTKSVPIQVCSDADKAYSVLLSKAKALSGSFSLDAAQKQTGAKAMVVKLALQMVTAKAEYGFFFGGFLAIAAQLVHSTDPSRPGMMLLLSPAFKLQKETLPVPNTRKQLTPFQAGIQPEPFLAILVAMLCAKLIPGYNVKSLPATLLQPLGLPGPDTIPDADEAEEDGESFGDNEKTTGGEQAEESGIPECSLQVTTNAMILQHPWLTYSDIHRISVTGHPSQTLSDNQNIPAAKGSTSLTKSLSPSPLQPQNLLRAPRIPSTNVDTVTLLEQIRESRWSSIYTSRVEGDDKLRIMKLVSEVDSIMVLRELYMYEVALKDCSLVPKFYGIFHRPVAGWFGLLLEHVGDSLEDVYGSDWSYVKMDMSATEWKKLIDSVKKLHSLGVMHFDLEPRNVAQTAEGFKFFDFGRSEMHRCRRGCGELQDLLRV